MLSIITAIHNGLAINRIFHAYLKRYTHQAFELIIIDNASSDGSGDFFRSVGARVIRNEKNFSYSYCQNQGIAIAQYDVLVFMNNDIIVPPQWDVNILKTTEAHGLEVLSLCGIEKVENQKRTNALRRRWHFIKNVVSFFGQGETMLMLMHRLMFPNWERFSQHRWNTFGTSVIEGFVGNTVIMKRSALDKIGLWDERVPAADFDLYVRTKKRHIEQGDILPMHLSLGVFNHHFIRLTAKAPRPLFEGQEQFISLEEKWGKEKLDFYIRDHT